MESESVGIKRISKESNQNQNQNHSFGSIKATNTIGGLNESSNFNVFYPIMANLELEQHAPTGAIILPELTITGAMGGGKSPEYLTIKTGASLLPLFHEYQCNFTDMGVGINLKLSKKIDFAKGILRKC